MRRKLQPKPVPRIFLFHSTATIGALVLAVCLNPQSTVAWEQTNHQTIVDYAAQKATALTTPLSLSVAKRSLLQQGAYDEDDDGRPVNHAYNPMTDAGFPLGGTARNEIATRWIQMTGAFSSGNYDGGDNSGAWHYLGRVSHLMQDMGSPLHSLAIEHLSPSCQFELYWKNNDPALRTILSSIGGPLQSSVLDPKATEKLDSFTATRLQDRFNSGSPNKNNDDPRGWVEVMAWHSYFRATFWGQVTMGANSGNGLATSSTTTATPFSDGAVAAQVNALHTMFGNGNVRWINSFIGDDYYEITDRNGSVFRYMSATDIDDWSACGHDGGDVNDGWAYGQKDSSIRANGGDDDDDGVRVTGRFWFDLRELGKNTSGTANRYCFPVSYPDGSSMSDHLHQYFGSYNGPLAVRYNAGLLGLANRRITVASSDSVAATFSLGRADNFGNGPNFTSDSTGSNFYFVAKSQVTLTTAAVNASGGLFVRWLKNGAAFSGNGSRTITINTASDWIPDSGLVYTAEYCNRAANGLVAWWPGDGHAFSLTGVPGEGMLSNGGTYADALVGKGFTFSGISDAVIVPDSPALHLESFTIEGWMKRANTNQSLWLFACPSGGYGIVIRSSGALEFVHQDIGSITSGFEIADTRFHHVAVTRSANSIIVYLDGVASSAFSDPGSLAFHGNCAIGNDAALSSNPAGIVDEIALYNHALTSAEIQGIFTAGSEAKCTAGFLPRFAPALKLDAAGTHITLITQPGTENVLYASSNLVNWTAIATNVATGSILNFIDPSRGTSRFYHSGPP